MKMKDRKLSIYNQHILYSRYKEESEEHRKIKAIYQKIKIEYLSNDQLDITLERIYLVNKFNVMKGMTGDFVINIIMTTLAAFLGTLFSKYIYDSEKILYVIAFIFIISIVYMFKKEIIDESNGKRYFKICELVLDEIEKMTDKEKKDELLRLKKQDKNIENGEG